MAERIIGIDFGTSTSVIRVKRYENGKSIGEKLETKEVIFSGIGATVPTLIQKKDDDESIVYYGYEALQKRKKTTTYHSFKVDLESSDPEKRAQARALTEEFFCYLAKVYKSQSDGGHLGNPDDKERTIVSYPVKWNEDTRNFMLEAAKKTGFPNVTGMDEAQAAIQAVTVMSEDHLRKNGLLVNGKPSNILLIDMGAGTTDLVLCSYTPGENANAEILSTWPKDGEILFGGREVDSLLQNFFRDMLDEKDAQLVFKRVGVDKFKSWKEETVSPALLKGDTVSDFDALDTCIEMADIEMDDYCLDRAAFETCLENYLKQLPELINGCIESAGIKGIDVDLVIVTGGHSQWYFVQEMLSGKMPQFGEADLCKIKENPSRIIPITRPQETVALGLVYSPVQSPVPPKPVPPKPIPSKTPVEDEYTPEEEFDISAVFGGDCYVRHYTGYRKNVSIPPTIQGKKVIGITSHCFSFNKKIQQVTIPDTVERIGSSAFSGCERLHTVIAHKGIRQIGEAAFYGCKKLKVLHFGVNSICEGTLFLPHALQQLGKDALVTWDCEGTFCSHKGMIYHIDNKKSLFAKIYISKNTMCFGKVDEHDMYRMDNPIDMQKVESMKTYIYPKHSLCDVVFYED